VLVGLGFSSSTPSLFNYKLKSLVEHFNNKFSADSKFIFINTTLESDAQSDGNNFGLLKFHFTYYN